MILDGYGLNENTNGNAVAQAATPVMDIVFHSLALRINGLMYD